MWCKRCKTEYREGFDKCSDCGDTLVDLPEDWLENDKTYYKDKIKTRLLITAPDGFEANRYLAALKDAGIPALLKHREAGGYVKVVMGNSIFGMDIFVSEEHYAKARETLIGIGALYPNAEDLVEETGTAQAIIDDTGITRAEKQESLEYKAEETGTFLGDIYFPFNLKRFIKNVIKVIAVTLLVFAFLYIVYMVISQLSGEMFA